MYALARAEVRALVCVANCTRSVWPQEVRVFVRGQSCSAEEAVAARVVVRWAPAAEADLVWRLGKHGAACATGVYPNPAMSATRNDLGPVRSALSSSLEFVAVLPLSDFGSALHAAKHLVSLNLRSASSGRASSETFNDGEDGSTRSK